MNPKCLGGMVPDTFSARSDDLTGAKMRRITRGVSFDHLVGEREQVVGNRDALRLRCLEIDGQLELVYLLHRQVGGRGTFENLDGIKPVLPVNLGEVLAVAQHAAGDQVLAVATTMRWPIARAACSAALNSAT
jgi:hypothetical protein